MLLIENFLSDQKVTELKAVLDSMQWVDGSATGGDAGARVKNNLQANPRDPQYSKADRIVREAIIQNEALQLFAFPHLVTPIRFSRYSAGMSYGEHFDAALMPIPNAVLRTDLSFTLFLSHPEEYEGGELVIAMPGIEKPVKPARGDLYLYESGQKHRVNEVYLGVREAAVGWIQSVYRTREQRQVLFNISKVHAEVFEREGKSESFELLNEAFITLARMWSRT